MQCHEYIILFFKRSSSIKTETAYNFTHIIQTQQGQFSDGHDRSQMIVI